MNGVKAFFDTNVLLYMFGGDAAKKARTKELFRQYSMAGRLFLSTQVVQEFYVAGSRKLGIPHPQVNDATTALLDSPLIVVGPSHITSAIQHETRYKISFWDALILAAAESEGAAILYTEDLNHGQHYGTVLVQNPFRSPDQSNLTT